MTTPIEKLKALESAATPSNLDFYLKNGCHHAALGNAKIPDGYAIMQDQDGEYTFWIGPNGEEGVQDWNKWRSLKRAKAHAEKHRLAPVNAAAEREVGG